MFFAKEKQELQRAAARALLLNRNNSLIARIDGFRALMPSLASPLDEAWEILDEAVLLADMTKVLFPEVAPDSYAAIVTSCRRTVELLARATPCHNR